jgi:hypothetical protein
LLAAEVEEVAVVEVVEVVEVEVEDAVAAAEEVLRVREQGSLPREARRVRREPAQVDRALAAPQRLPHGQPAVRPLRVPEPHSGQRKLAT